MKLGPKWTMEIVAEEDEQDDLSFLQNPVSMRPLPTFKIRVRYFGKIVLDGTLTKLDLHEVDGKMITDFLRWLEDVQLST